MLETVNKPEYASMPPCEIVPSLADKGVYIASESTFYRILREEKMQNHRGRAAEPHPSYCRNPETAQYHQSNYRVNNRF